MSNCYLLIVVNCSNYFTLEGRTFGKIRRMQMALVPLVFKFGFLYAMVAFLILLGIKTLFVVKMLLVLNSASLLGKLLSWKLPVVTQHSTDHYPIWNGPPAYEHHPSFTSANAYQPNKEIHLHLHGGAAAAGPHVTSYSLPVDTSNGGWHHRSDPYVGLTTAYNADTSQPLEQKIAFSGQKSISD